MTTDKPPPSDQMPKIQGGVICSEFEKNTRGDPYYQFSKFEALEKKQGGTLMVSSIHLSKKCIPGHTFTRNVSFFFAKIYLFAC